MSGDEGSPWLARFLRPRHALAECAIIQWHGCGYADTPGADAWCRIRLRRCEPTRDRGLIDGAAFAAFGPPVVIACADWACEWLTRRPIAQAGALTTTDFEQALMLQPDERYAALLVGDAVASALVNLGR